MFKNGIVLFFVLFISNNVISQEIRINGKDSIKVSIINDTVKNKIYFNKTSLKPAIVYSDSLRIAKNDSALLGLKEGADSIKVNKLLKKILGEGIYVKIKDSIINNIVEGKNVYLEILDTTNLGGKDNDSKNPFVNNNQPSPHWFNQIIDTKPILFLIVGLLLLSFLLFILLLRNGRRTKSSQSHNVNEYEFPGRLLTRLKINKHNTNIEEVTVKFIHELESVDSDLKQQKHLYEDLSKKTAVELSGYRTELGSIKEESRKDKIIIENLKEELKNKNSEIESLNKKRDDFKKASQLVIDKYYFPMADALDRNTIKDNKDIYKLILKNVFAIAFSSSSLIKKLNKEASNSDDLNIELLNGGQSKPIGTITENSQYNNTDALAYHSFHLLKSNEVQSLDNVFIHGYKIGE